MARILMIGKNGQLGWELHRTLATPGELTAVDYPEIDLERPETVCNLIRQVRPQVVVNAAAYTAVDQAESEQERARKINALAPEVLAEEARKKKIPLIHSTSTGIASWKASDWYKRLEALP